MKDFDFYRAKYIRDENGKVSFSIKTKSTLALFIK